MSKFCNNCGSEMEDDVVFCPNCGAQDAPAYQEAPAAYNEEQTYGETYEEAAPEQEAPAKNNNLIKLIIAGGAAVVVIILAILIFGSSPQKAINNYQAALNGNAGKFVAMAPNAYWTYAKDEGKVAKADVKKEYKDQYEDMKEDLEDTFGKNAKIKIKVTDKKKMSKKDLKAVGDYLEEAYEIDDKKVKAGWEMEVEITYKGKDDDMEFEDELRVVKIGGQWYVVEGIDGVHEIALEDWDD